MRDWLAARVRASPDATALIEDGSDERLTYAELDARTARLRAGLQARGVAAGDHVGSVLEAGPGAVSLVHAVARLGAVLVPLSPRLTAEERRVRVRQADCELLVHKERTDADATASASVDRVALDDLDAPDAEGNARSIAFDDPLVSLFTSGTTGRPKAVVLTAGNVLASAGASATRLGTSPDDRWLSALSIGGMGGLAPIYRAVLYGTALVLKREFDARGTVEVLSARACTGVSLVPTMLSRVLDVIEGGKAGETDNGEGLPASLRCVLLGGAPASKDLIERCRVLDVPVYPTYGMTETASQVATARPEEAFGRPGTVGRPLFGVEVRAVEDGRTLDAGEEGELLVSGPVVSPGYYDDPEATAAAFSELGFHTGDVGYVDSDGRVWVTGRADDRILTGGQTVDPAEVTRALCAHPAVSEAAVVGLDSEQWGQRVGALVIPSPDLGVDHGPETDTGEPESELTEASASELRAFCRERLARYKLPRTIVVGDRLPRTQSGTVDRVAVAERLSATEQN